MSHIDAYVFKPRFGQKLALLSCVIALLTAALISGFYTYRTKQITLQNSIDTLAYQTRLLVPSFQGGFMMMQNDAFILSHFPAINDYARYENHKAEYIARKRTPEQLKVIITTYFKTLISLRSPYTQVRYIGLKDNGKELIRVKRTPDGPELVEDDKLEEKAGEPYFKDSLSLKKEESYFSIVSLPREHGKIATPREVTIRHVAPVFDGEGHLFGFIVINANYESLLQASLEKVKAQGSLLVINDAGDYTIAKEGGKFENVQFHEDENYISTMLSQKILGLKNSSEASFIENVNGIEQIVYFIKIPFDRFSKNANGRYTGIALIKPINDFLAPQKETLRDSMALALILIFLSPFMAWPLARAMHNHFEDLLGKLTLSKASEKKALIEFKAIFENAVDGLVTIDTKGVIQSFNPTCEKMFGYKAEEVVGKNIKILMPDHYANRHEDYLENYHRTHEAKVIGKGREVEGKRKNGDIFPIDLSVSEVNTGTIVFYSGIVRDISERKKADNLLRATNVALVKSNAELDDFAYIASHDLKEPLRAIYNHTRFMMEDHADELPEGAKTRMNRLLDVCLRMDKLIDDLLNFSRLSRNEITRHKVDMNALVDDAIQNLAPYIEEKNGKIIVEPYLPPAVCDKIRIVSVIQNLMVNALKYNDNDEKIIKIGYKQTQLHDGHEEKDVYFVEDNGIGIDEKYKESVFRIFKRLHNPKTYGDGTGSGLTFTKKNIERHGGSIWFESIVGKGTVFYFTLKEKDHV